MPRVRKSEPNPVSDAVRKLRQRLGHTQQGFAHSLGVAITTVARWETTRPPKGKILTDLSRLAHEHNEWELARILGEAFRHEFGLKAERALVEEETAVMEDMLQHLDHLLRGPILPYADPKALTPEEKAKVLEVLNYVAGEMTELRDKMHARLMVRDHAAADTESTGDEQASQERSDQK